MQLNSRYVLDNFQRDASISIFTHSFLLPLLYILRNAGDFVIFIFSILHARKEKKEVGDAAFSFLFIFPQYRLQNLNFNLPNNLAICI